MRLLGCPYCVTVLSSLTQVFYWLDIIEGKRRPPDTLKLKELLCFEQADDERWHYDLIQPRSIIVEVCTAKTLWYMDHPVSLLANYRRDGLGVPTRLVTATSDELCAELHVLRQRLPGKFLVFVCQQSYQADNFSMYYGTVEARQMIRDVIFRSAGELPDCAAYDPTARVAEMGVKTCLTDLHHWTTYGGQVFSEDIENLIPENFK